MAETFATIKATQLAYRNAVPANFPAGTAVVRKTVTEFEYDCAVHGGSPGKVLLGILRPYLSVTKVTYDVATSFTSAGANAAKVSVGILSPSDLIAESALTSALYNTGTNQSGYPDGTLAKSFKLLDKTEVYLTIKDHALLTGKLKIKIEQR